MLFPIVHSFIVTERTFGNVSPVGRPQKVSDAAVVEATVRAIAAVGPRDLTVADVSRLAGIAPATIVERFGSKRNLLLAVAAAGSDHLKETFAARSARSRSPLRALEATLIELAASLGDPAEAGNHLAFLALDLTDLEFRAHLATYNRQLHSHVLSLLDEASKRGELRPGARPSDLAQLVLSIYQGTLLLWSVDQQGELSARLRRQLRMALEP